MAHGGVRVLRNLNERSLLTELMLNGPLTSLDLETRTGLSKPAVARMLVRVEQAGLAERVGTRSGGVGPAAQLWDVYSRVSLVAGVDIQMDRIEVMIVDIQGAVLAHYIEYADAAEGYDAWQVLLRCLTAATASAGMTLTDLDDIVLGLPGIIDPVSGQVVSSDRLPSWTGFNVASEMGSALRHESVHVENDVNLVALAEQSQGAARDVESALMLWMGAGIRVAVFRDGELMRSSRGTIGEIGTAIVPDPTPLSRFDRLGGPLEDILSLRAMEELAAHRYLNTASGVIDVLRTTSEVEPDDSDRPQDPAQAFLNDIADCIAVGLSSPVGLLDPDVVVLAGPVGLAGSTALADRVASRLDRVANRAPRVYPSHLGDKAIILGAVEHGLRIARERIYASGTGGTEGPEPS